MGFHAAFAVMEFRPPVYRQAERDGCGVECKHLVLYKELLQTVTLPAGNVNEPVGIFLENSGLTHLVSLAEITTCNALAKAKAVELGTMRIQGDYQVAHALAI